MENIESAHWYQFIEKKINDALAHININSRDLIMYVSVASISFLVGIILRRYGAMIISWALSVMLLGSILYYFNLWLPNVAQIKSLLFLSDVHSWDDLVLHCKVLLRPHLAACLMSGIFLMLGFKLG